MIKERLSPVLLLRPLHFPLHFCVESRPTEKTRTPRTHYAILGLLGNNPLLASVPPMLLAGCQKYYESHSKDLSAYRLDTAKGQEEAALRPGRGGRAELSHSIGCITVTKGILVLQVAFTTYLFVLQCPFSR